MQRLAFWLVALTVVAVAPTAAGITVDYARGIDYSEYRTFSWDEGTAATDPDSERLLRRVVTEQLLAEGLAEVESGGDLVVRTHVVVREEGRHDVDILGVADRWTVSGESFASTGEYLREIDVGTVAVDLLDGHSELQVWRATATAVLRPEAAGASEKRVRKAVAKMFRKFPPQ